MVRDEARVGQKNKITRRWAKRGSRPSAPKDQRTASTYNFDAIAPKDGKGAALVLPKCDTQAMNLHLVEIARNVAPGAHAVLMLDQADWHTTDKLDVPKNIAISLLPPKRPELNPTENIWQFLRDNRLWNRELKSYDEIIDHCCNAWNRLVDQSAHASGLMGLRFLSKRAKSSALGVAIPLSFAIRASICR